MLSLAQTNNSKTEALTLKNIEKVFNRNNKKPVQLNELFENPPAEKDHSRVHRQRLHELITLICTSILLAFPAPQKDFIKPSDILNLLGFLGTKH